jgi:hypothetical protein
MAEKVKKSLKKFIESRLGYLEKKTEEIEKLASVCFLPKLTQEAMSFAEMKKEFYDDLREIKLGRLAEELSDKEVGRIYRRIADLTFRVDKAITETFEKCNYSKKE